MRVVYMHEEQALHEFVRKAALTFADDPDRTTYTNGPIGGGCLFALRWGSADDCVLVFRVDEAFEPVVYGQAIPPEEER